MKKLIENVKPVTQGTIEKVVNNTELSKSQKIRNLFDLGIEVNEISKLLKIRYNFAYNIVSNYININGIKLAPNEKVGKKEQILALHSQGKTVKEISIELKANTNYIYTILKNAKVEKVTDEQKASIATVESN
jgi:hypothetical protein